jgi:Xaa-Pro aminopeptidase
LPRRARRLAAVRFPGTNAIAYGLLGFDGLVSRRVFAFIPREGLPVGVQHAIEPGPWARWPSAWPRRIYSGWRSLEQEVATLVAGKRIAMEYSPGDAIPYLDRVPAGVLEMVRATGATVCSSGELVSQVYATWTAPQRASHERAAEQIRGIALEAIAHAGAMVAAGTPVAEHELQRRILEAFARAGLETDHGPDVPPGECRQSALSRGGVTAADSARRHPAGGSLGARSWRRRVCRPDVDGLARCAICARHVIWEAVRDARDAALSLLTARIAAGEPVRGGEADDAARAVITERGFGPQFWHRTGHSIDARELHGSGPQIDNLESRDDRLLIPGVGFSIEPGIYVPGEIGMRTEVNCFVGDDALLVTPGETQRDLIVV